jgi:hypothetical protein
MKRRKFLKNIFGSMVLFPFISLIKKEQYEPVVFGVDKAMPGKDQTVLIICELIQEGEAIKKQ